MDATVVPLHRPRLGNALDDLDEIRDQLERIQDGIKILVHDRRIDGSGFRDLHITTALIEIGNVRHDLAQLSSLSEVDTSLAVDVANLATGLRDLVGELGAVATSLETSAGDAAGITVDDAPRIELGDDDSLLAAVVTAEHRWREWFAEREWAREKDHGITAHDVALVLVGSEGGCEGPRPRKGDVVRVGQALARLARAGRLRVVSKPYEHGGKRYAPRLECAECGRADDGQERGWTLRLDEDNELVPFCPKCDEREFGDA